MTQVSSSSRYRNQQCQAEVLQGAGVLRHRNRLRIHCYKGQTTGEGSRNNSWYLHSTGAFTQVSEKNKVRKRRRGSLGRQKRDLCGGSLVKQRPVPNKAHGSCHSTPAFVMAPGEDPLTKRLGSLTL